MINLAVIDLKDIVKYLLKISVIIVMVVALTKFFSSFKTKLNTEKNPLLECLDTVVPSISTVNKKETAIAETGKIEPLKMALGIELGVIDSLEKNGTETVTGDITEANNEITNEGANGLVNETSENNIDDEEIQEAETGLKTEVLENNVPEKYTSEYNGVRIRNETDNIKLTKEMLVPNVNINTKNILIYHTHTCESYTPTEAYTYKESGNFRTTDLNCNMVRVGRELTKYMQHYGYNVIHDETIYDSSYSQSYDRSLKGVAKLLEENEDTDILFDMHRDAIGDSSYAPTVKIGDEEAAQLMFVIGSNGGGSEHDNWNENLKLAIKIQEKANELYPGLFKPIILRDSRYNQQLAKGASIIEVGATGNTMEQCLVSMKYLSKVLSEVLK